MSMWLTGWGQHLPNVSVFLQTEASILIYYNGLMAVIETGMLASSRGVCLYLLMARLRHDQYYGEYF